MIVIAWLLPKPPVVEKSTFNENVRFSKVGVLIIMFTRRETEVSQISFIMEFK